MNGVSYPEVYKIPIMKNFKASGDVFPTGEAEIGGFFHASMETDGTYATITADWRYLVDGAKQAGNPSQTLGLKASHVSSGPYLPTFHKWEGQHTFNYQKTSCYQQRELRAVMHYSARYAAAAQPAVKVPVGGKAQVEIQSPAPPPNSATHEMELVRERPCTDEAPATCENQEEEDDEVTGATQLSPTGRPRLTCNTDPNNGSGDEGSGEGENEPGCYYCYGWGEYYLGDDGNYYFDFYYWDCVLLEEATCVQT